MSKNSFLVGDLIIDSSQIYTIVKIENDRLFYQPLNQNQSNHNCLNSIPMDNLNLAFIRPLLTKSEITDILNNLPKQPLFETPKTSSNRLNNSNFFKDTIYLNDFNKTAKLLIHLIKLKKETGLSSLDETIYDQALTHLTNEVSLVFKISFKTAQDKILKSIKK